MNQDFTEKKKAIFVRKKIRAEGFTWNKIRAHAVSKKKDSRKLKIPSLRSKPSRTTRTKFGPRERGFWHSGCTKNEARAKKWKDGGGGGKRREIQGFAGKRSLLSPPPSFCSRPIFRAARISFVSFGNTCYAGEKIPFPPPPPLPSLF